MKIYTLTIVYSDMNGEVYDIEEKIDDEGARYEIGGRNLEDVIDEEGIMNILRYESTEIASA